MEIRKYSVLREYHVRYEIFSVNFGLRPFFCAPSSICEKTVWFQDRLLKSKPLDMARHINISKKCRPQSTNDTPSVGLRIFFYSYINITDICWMNPCILNQNSIFCFSSNCGQQLLFRLCQQLNVAVDPHELFLLICFSTQRLSGSFFDHLTF